MRNKNYVRDKVVRACLKTITDVIPSPSAEFIPSGAEGLRVNLPRNLLKKGFLHASRLRRDLVGMTKLQVLKQVLTVFLSIFILSIYLLCGKKVYAQTELTVSVTIGDTSAEFSGRTSPLAQVTIVEDETIKGTTTADENGIFSKTLTAQTTGIHSFGVYSTDTHSVSTSTVNYSISLTGLAKTSVGNIFLPPTISLSKNTATQGETIDISGMTIPSSTITLFIASSTVNKTTIAETDGNWKYSLETGDFDTGDHTVYAKATVGGTSQSEQSKTNNFKIVAVLTQPTLTPTVIPSFCFSSSSLIASSVIRFFDVNGNDRIEKDELYESMKRWVRLWLGGKEERICDFNGDRDCTVKDFSILLFCIEY